MYFAAAKGWKISVYDCNQGIGLMIRVFANGLGDLGLIQIQKVSERG